MLEEKITQWITEITKEGELPQRCQAVYLGLFENETGYMMNFVGSVDFDAEDDDWACDEEEDYFPKNRYLESGVTTETDWERFQDEVVNIIKKLKKTPIDFPPKAYYEPCPS
jgi:hypothetical protein